MLRGLRLCAVTQVFVLLAATTVQSAYIQVALAVCLSNICAQYVFSSIWVQPIPGTR